ncbi:MAG: nicotinamide mononucleotide transporter [Ferruginibacter sp.]
MWPKNSFIANSNEKPYWGIGILGVAKANNIQLLNNTIKDFSAGAIVANPAEVIDTMIIDGNILTGNGYANRPAFNAGVPQNYFFKNNISNEPSIFSGANIKMNIIRPFYYSIKSISILEFIAVFAGIIALLFSRRENIYFYPMALMSVLIYTFISLEKEIWGQVIIKPRWHFNGHLGLAAMVKKRSEKTQDHSCHFIFKKRITFKPGIFCCNVYSYFSLHFLL